MGASEDDIREALGGADNDQEFGVWRSNVDTVALFLCLQTQWRVGPMGGYLGLEYPGVQAVLRLKRVKDSPGVFAHLQAMEAAALPVLNKRDD